ncbi:nuclear pore protein 84/107 [Pleurotus eryngii]|uniref:Nuclear pore complex protein n=1 Tax=Pleurotus eryngii TaxID=5323 RepID=A0A9P5ZIU9_PLEER|nr:nuclear pore protein 84/107 [Pleurotus eryngii]
MANALYASCAEVLSLCQTLKDDLPAILDPETGFAPRLRRVCHEQLEEFEQTPASAGMSQEELDVLKLEANTWGLLQAIMPPRKVEALPMPSPRDLLAQNPFTPTSTLAQAIMNTSPLLTELIVVREWLQEIAPPPQHPEATTGYWKFTKHSIMQTLRSAGGPRDGLVKEMDPDVVNKGDGRALDSDDANYEKSLANALYTYVRAGRLDEAIELCRKAHQPWRAASIRGSRLFQWKAIASEVSEDDDEADETDAWQGNRRRRLWKSTCVRAALNPALPQSERVLFSALAPSPQTSTILKSACRTWEDHLWAQLSIVCEEKESMEMALLANKSFWEGGEVTDDSGGTIDIDREQEEEEWEKEVVGTLEGLKSVAVFEGQAADHAFHVSQLHIILDRTSTLLEIFANGLTDGIYADTSSEYSTMCRFFAHLCLFLRMIDIAVPPLAAQIILEAYIRVLEGAGQRDLIAMYAGALGENAIERYALFLTSLELSTDLSERRLALTRGMDHGLDLDRVAITTAERTIEKAFELLPPLAGPLPSVIAMQPPASETEQLLLRSIEWTTFSSATFHTALEQANVILRYFLGSGRVNVAQQLLGMLPPELAAIGEPEEMATEYLHYQQFFAIWEALERVVECESLESPQMNRETRSAWLKDYTGLIDTAHEKIVKLLTSEWLVSDVDVITNDRRRRGLVRIRQLYIPELIIRLHHILVTSRHKIPGNAKLALQLANIVADSRYKLYDDFVGEGGIPLSEYLGAVRQAIISGLEGGGSDPLRLLTR